MLPNAILSTEIIAFWQMKTLLRKTQDTSAKPYSYYICYSSLHAFIPGGVLTCTFLPFPSRSVHPYNPLGVGDALQDDLVHGIFSIYHY